MAFDDFRDTFRQIKKNIERTHGEDLESTRKDEFSNENERKKLLKHIRSLENDIEELEEKVKIRDEQRLDINCEEFKAFLLQKSDDSFQTFLGFKTSTEPQEKPSKRKKPNPTDPEKPQIKDMELQIQTLAKLTGISFNKTFNVLLPGKEGKKIRRYTLQGQSFGIPFLLHFETDEEELVVVNLKAKGPPDAFELEPLIRHVEEEKSLRDFFNGLSDYAELSLKRYNMFQVLKEKYPECFRICYGRFDNLLHFVSPNNKHFEWKLEWSLGFHNGRISQQIQFYPIASTSYDLKLLTQFPVQFKNLVEQKGLRATLEILAKLCCLEQ